MIFIQRSLPVTRINTVPSPSRLTKEECPRLVRWFRKDARAWKTLTWEGVKKIGRYMKETDNLDPENVAYFKAYFRKRREQEQGKPAPATKPKHHAVHAEAEESEASEVSPDFRFYLSAKGPIEEHCGRGSRCLPL